MGEPQIAHTHVSAPRLLLDVANSLGGSTASLAALSEAVLGAGTGARQGLTNLQTFGPLRYTQHWHILNLIRVFTQFLEYG